MQLDQIRLRDFRCFETFKLDVDPELNWIVGQNASGKTSLLEALFFLGHGRSFRNSRADRLVRAGAEAFEIVARLSGDGRESVLGVGRREGTTTIRFAGETLRTMTEAARILPSVVLDSGVNELVAGGPAERRRWLDWGVFHVEHSFLAAWQAFRQALRQRNEALRAGSPDRAILPWNRAVAEAGEKLSALRQSYFATLEPQLMAYASEALPGIAIEFAYRQGWAQDASLLDALQQHLPRDRETGTTRTGPHRAEIQLRVAGLPASERLSRGQQKMLAGAMWLAQVNRFTQQAGQRLLLLVDDLAAELDMENLSRFLALLNTQRAQLVLTAISDTDITRTGLTGGRVFHVEHPAD